MSFKSLPETLMFVVEKSDVGRKILNEVFFSLRISMRISMRSCPRFWFWMRFLVRFLIFDEVLDEVLDSQWGSCPRPHWDLDFGAISLRFWWEIFFRKGNFKNSIGAMEIIQERWDAVKATSLLSASKLFHTSSVFLTPKYFCIYTPDWTALRRICRRWHNK